MRIGRLLLSVAALTCSTGLVLADDLGDPAPELDIAKWCKGEPITFAEGKDKNIFVLEFWGTTCPHCRACVPRLTEMQKKFADQGVVFIGISPEPIEKIDAYVKELGDKIGYRIAADNNRKTDLAYRGKRRIQQVPYAFLIGKEGKLIWHGHPMSGLDAVIEGVLKGTYDIEQGRRWAQARGYRYEYFRAVKSLTRAAKAREIGDKVLEYGKGEALLLNDFAWLIVTEPGLMKRDLELARKAIELANKDSGGKDARILDTFARVLFVSNEKKEAVEYEKKAIELAESDEERKEYEKTLAEYVKAAED